MKWTVVFITFSIISIAVAEMENLEKHKKPKKYRRPGVPIAKYQANEFAVDDDLALHSNAINNRENVLSKNEEARDNDVLLVDPCVEVHCGAGRICEVDESGEPQCVCIPECPTETEARRKVCSNHNETWPSDCSIYQQRCLCNKGDVLCKSEIYKHVHIDYYGECREIKKCTEDEMIDFPRRMRDWLFNIMRDLADRADLTPHYMKMQQDAESNLTLRWMNAAVWKFCDLDGNPPDRSISRHELFPIRAPLVSLEHCIAPFLSKCDPDEDHRITLREWAHCLELDEETIQDQCEQMQED